MYKIYDRQIGGRYFADGAVFHSLDDVQKQLSSYHSIDWEGEKDIEKLSLTDLCEYGDWEIEDMKGNVI